MFVATEVELLVVEERGPLRVLRARCWNSSVALPAPIGRARYCFQSGSGPGTRQRGLSRRMRSGGAVGLRISQSRGLLQRRVLLQPL